MVPPGMPSTGLQIPVFASTNKAGTAKVTQHFIVLQPGDKEMTVSEGLLYVGDPSLTYYDPVNGSVRFYVPPEATGTDQRHRQSGRAGCRSSGRR